MRPLLALSARFVALAVGLVLAVGAFGGLVRLMPWLASREVPLALALPFARVLFATALEVALLVGLPVGAAVAAATFVERGEARALLSLGASPARLVATLVVPGVVALSAYVAVARAGRAEPLGVLAARLLDAGRASCGGAPAGRVDVPLVSLTWLCLRDGPRLSGNVPGFPEAFFSAKTVQPSADFGEAALEELDVAARLGSRIATVHARAAHLSGLPRWGAARSVAPDARSFVVALAALAAALAVALAVLGGSASPLASAGGAALVAVTMLVALRALDARLSPLPAYALVPLAGVTIPAVLARLREAVARVARGRAR